MRSSLNPEPFSPETLEAAMERLDGLVAEMEAGSLSLESLIEKYEEGIRLSQFCRKKLEAAEAKILQITKDGAGNVTLEPFEVGSYDS